MNFLCLGTILLLFQLPLGWWLGYIIKLVGCVLFIAGLAELRDLCKIQAQRMGSEEHETADYKGFGGLLLGKYSAELIKGTDASQKQQYGFEAMRRGIIAMLMRNARMSAVIFGGSAVVIAGISVGDSPDAVINAFSVLLGLGCSAAALRLVDGAIGFVSRNDELHWNIEYEDGSKSHNNAALHFCNNIMNIHRLESVFKKTAICTAVNLACDILNRIIPFTGMQSFFGFAAALSKITLYCFLVSTAINFNKVRNDCNDKYDAEYN